MTDISLSASKSSFLKQYKKYLLGGLAVVLILVIYLFLLKFLFSPASNGDKQDLRPVLQKQETALKGYINNKIGFTMHLIINGNVVEGTEHYDGQKSEANLSIKGTIDKNGHTMLHEYDNYVKCGRFDGLLDGIMFSGTFTNSKGKTFPFSANVLTESALSRIEKEEKRFETTKIVYKNNTSSANVELSIDYPIKGTDALLQNTRKYVSGVIAAMFHINEYRGSLNDGNSVINSYGKAKFDELDREWKEGATEGSPGYIETIEFTKDFENDYCVSLCAHSYFFHGGVSNEFCDASTFRKTDGKYISIINSDNDKGLHRLIIIAVKNKLGEDYEYVNEDFESSPVAGIIHLVKNGVQFDYQHYEIGPGYFGQVSITIPYEKIRPYMTEEAQNILRQ